MHVYVTRWVYFIAKKLFSIMSTNHTTMSATFRPRRVVPSAVNTPTAIHVTKTTGITNEEAETILSDFISVSELIATTVPGASHDEEDVTSNKTGFSNSTGNSAVLGQLRRVQRDLRGLPPLVQEPEVKKHKFDDDSSSTQQPLNKKIKFDDSEEESVQQEEKQDVEEEKDDEEEPAEEEIDNVDEQEAVEDAQEEPELSEKKKEKKEKKDKKSKKEKKEKKKHHS